MHEGIRQLLVLGPLALLVGMYLIYRFRFPAAQLGLVDVPGGRKTHSGHVPLVGGIGVFVTFSFVALLIEGSLEAYRPLFAGMGLLIITGVLDDLHDLSALEKVTLQLVATLVLIFWGDLLIVHVGVLPLIGKVELASLAVPFTIVCVIGLINAVNMLDGSDGLAGGVLLSMFFWLSVIGIYAANYEAMILPALMGVAILAFLMFNFPFRAGRSASVFMGDSGSTMIGFAVAWFAIDLAFDQKTGVPPITIAWVLALPVFDTITLMVRRMLKGQSPVTPDRDHVHHIFERAGFSQSRTAYFFTILAFVMGGIGVGSWWLDWPEQWMWAPLLVIFILHFVFVHRAWHASRVLRRLRRDKTRDG